MIDGSGIGKDRSWLTLGRSQTFPSFSTGPQKLADCSTGQTVCKSQFDERRADLPYPIILVILGHAMDEGGLVWADLRNEPWLNLHFTGDGWRAPCGSPVAESYRPSSQGGKEDFYQNFFLLPNSKFKFVQRSKKAGEVD